MTRGDSNLALRIIPCLDVDKGRVVKGVQYVDHVDAGLEGRVRREQVHVLERGGLIDDLVGLEAIS